MMDCWSIIVLRSFLLHLAQVSYLSYFQTQKVSYSRRNRTNRTVSFFQEACVCRTFCFYVHLYSTYEVYRAISWIVKRSGRSGNPHRYRDKRKMQAGRKRICIRSCLGWRDRLCRRDNIIAEAK